MTVQKLIKNISRRIVRNQYLIYLKYAFLSRIGYAPFDTGEIDARYVEDFVRLNSAYWPAQSPHQQTARILVEGHLSQYGPNYLLRTAVAAKAAEAKLDAEIVVVFNGFRHQWDAAQKMYESFGIRNFIYLDSRFWARNIFFKLFSHVQARKIFQRLESVDDILNIRYNGVVIGDLIYDDILKAEHIYTLSQLEAKHLSYLRRAIYWFLQYSALMQSSQYLCLIATHTAYSEYGLLVRVALSQGVKAFETTDIQFSAFTAIADDNLPTFQQGIMNYINAHWSESWNNAERLSAKTSEHMAQLSKRMGGEIQQFDAILAYANKKTYPKKDLLEVLGIENDLPCVFIMTHIFVDSPHTSSWMLYRDYYDWLINTFDIIKTLQHVNWIVKPHPSSKVYHEEGEVKKLLQAYCPQHAYITPEDFSTKSLLECASAIVTVQGTAGVEFSCYGIPVVITGKAFYAGRGFTIEPHSVQEYRAILSGIHKLSRLSQEQILKAQLTYTLFNENFSWKNPIITTEILDNVWGSLSERNINTAYEIIIRNLTKHSPQELPAYQSMLNAL